MVRTIDREALRQKLDRREAVILLEALPEKYFLHSHLPGAINLPLDRLEEIAKAELADKAAEIVTYCANAACKNSGIAAEKLAALGYSNVRAYEGGKQDWIEAGYPVETGRKTQAA